MKQIEGRSDLGKRDIILCLTEGELSYITSELARVGRAFFSVECVDGWVIVLGDMSSVEDFMGGDNLVDVRHYYEVVGYVVHLASEFGYFFKEGDVVRCVSDEMPDFYIKDWAGLDGIRVGDLLEVESFVPGVGEWGGSLRFRGKEFSHSSRFFELGDRVSLALKFLETSGDVLQALKIAAGVSQR